MESQQSTARHKKENTTEYESTESRESLKAAKYSYDDTYYTMEDQQRTVRHKKENTTEYESLRGSRLEAAKYRIPYDTYYTMDGQQSIAGHEECTTEYESLRESLEAAKFSPDTLKSGTSTCSSQSINVVIKLSAEYLVSPRREEYLVNTTLEYINKHRSLGQKRLLLEFLVDLTELEFDEQAEARQDIRFSGYSSRRHSYGCYNPLDFEGHCFSLVVMKSKTEGNCSVSRSTIRVFSEIFCHLNKLFDVQSVDFTKCTLSTQISLLTRLLSAHDRKWHSMKVIWMFSKDFFNFKEHELMLFISQTKPLVVKGDIPKEEFQEFINYAFFSLAVYNKQLIHALIEAGADVNMKDKAGKTALFYAIDNENTIHALVEAGADVNRTDKAGKTALFYAIDNENTIHALIEAGADVNRTDKDGKTALFYAIDNENTIHALVKAGADVKRTDKNGKTALFYAIDNKNTIHTLVEAGADVNRTDKDGKTALFYAIDNENTIHALVKAGADVNRTDKDGKTALFYALDNKNTIHALIAAGADVNRTDNDGKTALFYAIDNENTIHALIAAGVDVNITDKDGKTALFYAVLNEKVTCALIAAGADVNRTDKDGKTALFYAVHNEKVTHALIAAGADVNMTDKGGKTPLFYAEQNQKVTFTLIEAGAHVGKNLKGRKNINLPNIHGTTPLMYAISNMKDEDLSSALIEAGADVDIIDEDGKTALFYAVDNEKVTRALIAAGADVNITDRGRKTALFYAVHSENVALKLIKAGTFLNKTEWNGKTALFYAIDNEKVTHALIEAGADVNIKDKAGKTALFYAVDNEKVTRAFLEAGADVNTIDEDGKTALFYVVNNGKITHALVEAGADVNMKDKAGKTALFYAVNNEKLNHALIEAGVDVNMKDKAGKTALFYAVDNGKVTHALIAAGADVNLTDEDGKTALFNVMNTYNDKVTQAMIEAGVDVNITDKDGKTALFNALDNEEVTNALIEAGADVNIADNNGKIALLYALNDEQITQTLIEAGADVNIADKGGKTALFYAFDDEEVTETLIEAGGDVNMKDKDGKTALFYVLDNERVTHALIEAGGDVNMKDKDGKTALFYAVHNEKATHALIAAGADVNMTDKDGKTALFYAVHNEKVTHALIAAGADVNVADKDGNTALLYGFDAEGLANVTSSTCKILLDSGARLCESNREQKTVFHLAIFLCLQKICSSSRDIGQRKSIFHEIIDSFQLFSQSSKSKVAVNKRDMLLNSPLHLWAELVLAPPSNYHENVFNNCSFEHMLSGILDVLLRCGVKLNYSNEQDKTPLHVCKTWTAVKLILNAGAKPDVTNSSGCTPLLVAATTSTCLKSGCLYPDVAQDPHKFWKEVLSLKLDPWTADKDGNSVLSILVKEGAERLAKALIEVACERKCVQTDAIGVPLLVTICKDKSIDKEWKVDLVKTLLKYRNSLSQESLSDKDTALHFCCRNLQELPKERVKTSVHWKIAQHLILCGADVETTPKDGKSCFDIAEGCPVLKDLLSIPDNIKEAPQLIDSWKPLSRRHRKQLEEVSRGFSCQHIDKVCYSKQALENGTFGLVFVGISLQDGKEIAVKRIETTRVENKENLKKEVEDLKPLGITRCEKLIECLLCTFDEDFLYVILELMEGNLDDLLNDECSFDINQETKLCRDICMGLNYLHNHRRNIIHRSIKPKNILYQVLPSGIITLKLAFFGLRSQMCKEQHISNFTDTYESLTKERCWMAPEVLLFQSHSKSSDVFSCGLVIHYLLSNKNHPFAPGGSSRDRSLTVSIETVDNIAHNKIELDEKISSDAKDLVKGMLRQDKMSRPKTYKILHHRFFQEVEYERYA